MGVSERQTSVASHTACASPDTMHGLCCTTTALVHRAHSLRKPAALRWASSAQGLSSIFPLPTPPARQFPMRGVPYVRPRYAMPHWHTAHLNVGGAQYIVSKSSADERACALTFHLQTITRVQGARQALHDSNLRGSGYVDPRRRGQGRIRVRLGGCARRCADWLVRSSKSPL